MAKVKAELEDLALRALILERLRRPPEARGQAPPRARGEINQVIAILQRKLSEVGIESQIRGRPKHFYSIWKKMHDQGREFDEIYDLTAVRVITPRSATATAPSASSTPCGSRCRAASRTSSRCPRSTCTSRSTRRSSGPRATRWRSRSAPGRCTASPRRASPPTGSTRRRRPAGQARRLAAVAPPAHRDPAGHEGPAGVHGHGARRPLPGRGLRVHAQGRREGAARGRDADRLRLRRHTKVGEHCVAPRSTESWCRCATCHARATSSRS